MPGTAVKIVLGETLPGLDEVVSEYLLLGWKQSGHPVFIEDLARWSQALMRKQC